ncbi:C39 family peptidase [Paenibacillus doosanensis]|uniref:C39 family peptidase n=1 Tax=Paenibacillus doosanensis TaxID=1229154 RepID=UPI00217F9E34|nr:C39 family peptidase [Paenibacillus doosanensis]MCS7459399.1 C39 family peptidase [Paenibacillus doosanensis]
MKVLKVLWKGLQVTFGFFLVGGLVFASGVFGVLLYAKITGQAWFEDEVAVVYAETGANKPSQNVHAPAVAAVAPETPPPAASAMLDAPAVKQYPELPSGCEVTSLTMLLQFAGIQKDKMELASEMPKDPTPFKTNSDGSIAYWGNPNTGFVGEVTGAAKGFGIYHSALYGLLAQYVPGAQDFTGKPFEKLEQQLREGIPSVVWTTIDYRVPSKWVVWDTPIGPIQTTFMEHAVLLVGFDEQNVYVNDPYNGKSKVKIDKEQFIQTWEAMGRQALSYTQS